MTHNYRSTADRLEFIEAFELSGQRQVVIRAD